MVLDTSERDGGNETGSDKVLALLLLVAKHVDSTALDAHIRSLLTSSSFMFVVHQPFAIALHQFIAVGMVANVFLAEGFLVGTFFKNFVDNVRHASNIRKFTEPLPHLFLTAGTSTHDNMTFSRRMFVYAVCELVGETVQTTPNKLQSCRHLHPQVNKQRYTRHNFLPVNGV